MRKNIYKRLISAIIPAMILTGCGTDVTNKDISTLTQEESSAADTNSGEPQVEDAFAEAEPETAVARLICAGDNLIHDVIYQQAARRAGYNGYDFTYVYENVEDIIKSADLAILNQETIVTDKYEPSNYPRFCTPEALGDHMADIGFDAVSMSNNHVLDQWEDGLLASIDYWDNEHPDIIRYGAYRDKEDMENIKVAEIKGITFAFLGYTEHTNGLSHTGELGTEIVYLDELDVIEAQIKQADEIADVVIVSPHFGTEVSNEVSDSQRELSQKFADWGADIIIGTQPHTIQECNWIERSDGSRAFVYYCLGNLVSAMADKRTMIGGLGEITIVKDMKTGEITLDSPKIIPIITHYGAGYSDITIYPYTQYNETLASSHGLGLSMDYIEGILSYVPKEFIWARS